VVLSLGSSSAGVVASRPVSVLLADTSPDARMLLEGALAPLGAQSVTHVSEGDDLERQFFEAGPYDLVVSRALLGARSALQVVARARALGRRASFIVYSSLDGPWL